MSAASSQPASASATAHNGNGHAASTDEWIRIRGARVHNLANVDLDIPRDRLVVITGPSGSGKSSLAFDTLYAEGQRQYIESLSVYARQFLHQMERPDVDLIDGLQPTICIDQRPGNPNPRSTVATVTEIYDYLRLLVARTGRPFCYRCDTPIDQQTPEQIREAIAALPEATKVILMAPMVRGRRGQHQEVLARIRKAGLVRVRVDGTIYDVDNVPELAPRKLHTIDAVVDRLIIRQGLRSRIGESVQLALRHGEGLAVILYLDEQRTDEKHPEGTWVEQLFSTLYACPNCHISYEELEPRIFSFNSPYGACPECDGLGVQLQFDPDLVVPNQELSLDGGAIAPWKSLKVSPLRKRAAFTQFASRQGVQWDTPLSQLRPSVYEKLLYGDKTSGFLGVLVLLEQQFSTATNARRLEQLASFRGQITCSACKGARLRPEARSVRIGGKAIHEITALAVREAQQFFASLHFPEKDQPIAHPLLTEIGRRLDFLNKVGVDYLTLDRASDTLSGGENQRVRLATSIGSGLVGVCYILDEPSIGLHQRDNQRLIDALRDLQQQGNTVLVVEHDEAMMRHADQLIDMGPGAGTRGGRIVAQGDVPSVIRDEQSITGMYLSGRTAIELPKSRRKASKTNAITLEEVTTNNLKNVTVHFPLGTLICVTGVSGSGKSSLINETLGRALVRRLGCTAPKPGPHKSLRGTNRIDKVIEIDQSPIGRTPRSNLATYTGAFDEIRKVFAQTRDARQRGYRSSRFSFNVKGGRCEECQGQGVRKIEMNFLPDLYITCSQCDGARFNRQTLQVKYKDRSIADVLNMPVDEATDFFENFATIHRLLQCQRDVGLGYLPLGQPSTTLSGGEAQRIKLATQLARIDTGKTFYLLDEPTTGLHFDDIKKLLDVLGRLVDRGNTVLVIEHNLDVVKCADWIIDLGPEGGAQGGEVVACGTPEEIAALPENHTGRFLKPLL